MATARAALQCVARRGFRTSAVSRASRPEQFHALNGGAQHSSITGSALEQSPGYRNSIHEQAELWWDDGRAIIEPVLDSDHIPLREAVSMLAAGFAFFGLIGGIQYVRDPAGNRPTIPREMPESEIWERNQYEKPASAE
eukprot:TRINITY_DN26671_c0_g1_i1.p1 TRINITY_DN26671_c0_g1~~TRINITY_DN26671_c0_g1_i1.p1  ORF type:complete len:139 (+),score=23.01 TRINITY_DN26671_c0_g1_i1:140-556(+)